MPCGTLTALRRFAQGTRASTLSLPRLRQERESSFLPCAAGEGKGGGKLLSGVVAGCTLLAAGGAATAAEPLAALLGKLAPPAAPQGSVDVVGWVERNGSGGELVVTFVPKGAVKLVADPGVTVTPVQRDGIAWQVTAPVSRTDAGEDYFGEPPTLRVPFAGADGKPVEAAVEYAYCLVDYQCLFGEARVSAPTDAPRG